MFFDPYFWLNNLISEMFLVEVVEHLLEHFEFSGRPCVLYLAMRARSSNGYASFVFGDTHRNVIIKLIDEIFLYEKHDYPFVGVSL